MKHVLAFGDSLTWGANAATGVRHGFEDIWPNAFQNELGEQVHVYAEGLNGRTTMFDDYSSPTDRNGTRVLPTLLATHEPLDLVIIVLGTNDMKPHVCGNSSGSAQGIKRLIQITKSFEYNDAHAAPEILVVSPPLTVERGDSFAGDQFEGSIELSKEYAEKYQEICVEQGVSFFDAATVVVADAATDGIHMDAENTRALGETLALIAREILSLD